MLFLVLLPLTTVTMVIVMTTVMTTMMMVTMTILLLQVKQDSRREQIILALEPHSHIHMSYV
jgi:hypothetical protein